MEKSKRTGLSLLITCMVIGILSGLFWGAALKGFVINDLGLADGYGSMALILCAAGGAYAGYHIFDQHLESYVQADTGLILIWYWLETILYDGLISLMIAACFAQFIFIAAFMIVVGAKLTDW
ncbi:MAG: hypothetical protein VZT48_08230 [Bulleidia sp.]|nr:hypothetical protein [Bulleidia sp.]